MIIQDNIIKHHLRNVYFITGTACGGKTTMAKMLAEKHGFILYDMDKEYEAHRAIADEKHQPDTCYHMKNFHEQWMRPVEEQARWNMSSLWEQVGMSLIDLIKLAERSPVVADVLYSPDFTQEIVDYNRMVILTVNKSIIRKQYFNRPEKQGFYEFVKSQPLAEQYFENIYKGLELTNDKEQELMRKSGFLMIERTPESTREGMLAKIEEHFGL